MPLSYIIFAEYLFQKMYASRNSFQVKSRCLKVLGFQVFLEPYVSLVEKISLQVLDYLDGEEKTCNFSFFAHWIPIVELPLEIILP